LEAKCTGISTFYVVYKVVSMVYIPLSTIFSSQGGEELQDFPDNDKVTGFYDPKIFSEGVTSLRAKGSAGIDQRK
jgi:hypothetical protein